MEFNWLLEFTDACTFIGGWIAKWLNARKYKICFVIWSLGSTYWIIRNYNLGLYSAPLIGFINIAINIYGYIYWGKKK